jgi:hypothetical protein
MPILNHGARQKIRRGASTGPPFGRDRHRLCRERADVGIAYAGPRPLVATDRRG